MPRVNWSLINEPDLSDRHEFTEDISHAVLDLQIPLLADRFNLYTNGIEPFGELELVKFRNTFTKRVAVWTGWDWDFHNSVEGYDSPVFPGDVNGVFNSLENAALGWMPLHVYDYSIGAESGPTLYQIISEFYSSEVFNDPNRISGGLLHQSLAEVVSAQWEHECFDLTLFNRELPYDQDFAARHVLTIDPAGEAGMSFADPRIPDARFTVLPGVHSTHRAGGAVIWEPGFEASYTSVVEAVIDPLGCGMAYRSQQSAPNGPGTIALLTPDSILYRRPTTLGSTAAAPDLQAKLLIVPNPNNGQASAHITLEEATTATLQVIDATGRRIAQRELGTLTPGEHRIDLPLLSTGIYHCRIELANTSIAERIVVE